MKGQLNSILSLLSLVFLVSCGTSAIYLQGFSVPDTSEGVALLSPVSCIYYIDAKGTESYDDSLSLVSEVLMASLIEQQKLPISSTLPLDSIQKEESIAFMQYLFANKPVELTVAPIPSVLDSLLETNNQRYGLLIYTEGMTRNRKQYAKDLAASTAFGILLAVATMGTFYTYNYSMLYAAGVNVAILDSDYDRVVFYNKIPVDEANPLSEKHMGKYIKRLFKDFNK